MSRSGIREQLSENNPFFSGSVADPWDNDDPDVISLNQEAYSHICKLIGAVNQRPDDGIAGLILGESGMGKTHLQKRLFNYTRQHDIAAVFVSVRPFLNPQKSMRHLLSEMVVSLEKQRAKGQPKLKTKDVSQFDYFIMKLAQRYQNNTHGFISRNRKAHFQDKCPGVSENVLEAIFNYADSRDDGKKNLILNWLKGGVHEDHSRLLNFQDRASMDDMELEAEARDIVVSFGTLLKYCGMSMIVCFDQLDGMRNQSLIDAFGDAIHVLVNDVSGILPLAFVREDTWGERFSRLDPAARDRLSINTIPLWACTLREAQELIRVRIAARFKDSAEEKYEWVMERLNGKLKEGYSPRDVIKLANMAIMQAPEGQDLEGTEPGGEVSVSAIFKSEYLQERDKVARDFNAWPPNAEHILKALDTYLRHSREYGDLRPGPDKYITLTGKYKNTDGSCADCAFIINTAGHPKTVQAAFERGARFLQTHPGGRCYYISDERCVFRDRTQWKKAHEVKDIFDACGGVTIILTRALAVSWYGLTSLIFKLEEGDISLPTGTGLRAATEKDFEIYMKEGFKENFFPPASAPSPTPPPPLSCEEKIFAIMEKSPMRMMSAALLAGRLQADNENITYEQLLEFLSGRKDKFALHPASDGSLVMLK